MRSYWNTLEDTIITVQEEILDLEDRFLDRKDKARQQRDKRITELRQDQRQAPSMGLPLVTDSKADYDNLIDKTQSKYEKQTLKISKKYGPRMEEMEIKLQNTLASPNSDEMEGRLDAIRPGTASRDLWELYATAQNLQSTLRELTSRLMLDRTNYELAVDTYENMAALLETVIQMNLEFIARVDDQYKPEVNSLIKRTRRAKETTRAMKDLDPILIRRETEKLGKIESALLDNLPVLDAMKEWTQDHMTALEPKIRTLSLLKQNVTIARDAANFVVEVDAAFEGLDITIPPIIEYELVESDFQLNGSVRELDGLVIRE
jgi:hypothetical protein